MKESCRFPANSIPLIFASDHKNEICIHTTNTGGLVKSLVTDVDLSVEREVIKARAFFSNSWLMYLAQVCLVGACLLR